MTNEIDYFEIGTPEPEAARAFYGSLFGWQIGPPAAPAQYAMIETDKGGLWDTAAMGEGRWAMFYVHVDDVQRTIDEAQRLGAQVAIPLIDNGMITFAHLIDPLGNRIGIWKPNDPAA
jgi:uncharacterized protein